MDNFNLDQIEKDFTEFLQTLRSEGTVTSGMPDGGTYTRSKDIYEASIEFDGRTNEIIWKIAKIISENDKAHATKISKALNKLTPH